METQSFVSIAPWTLIFQITNLLLLMLLFKKFLFKPVTDILEKFLVVTFSSIYKRCENINRFSAKLFGYDVNYLVVAVFHHFLASDIRICR